MVVVWDTHPPNFGRSGISIRSQIHVDTYAALKGSPQTHSTSQHQLRGDGVGRKGGGSIPRSKKGVRRIYDEIAHWGSLGSELTECNCVLVIQYLT